MKSEPAKLRLRQVVAAYGADPRRWPEDERRMLADAAMGEEGADWMIEAGALDRVLEQGRKAGASAKLDAGLADAILAKAAATPQVGAQGAEDIGTVVEFAAPEPAGGERTSGRRGGVLNHLPEAAILAASLLIGIWAGGNDVFDPGVFDIGVVSGLTGSAEDEINFISALVGVDLTGGEELL